MYIHMCIYVYVYIYIYIYIHMYIHEQFNTSIYLSLYMPGPSSRTQIWSICLALGGTTCPTLCLMRVFFNSGESCSK